MRPLTILIGIVMGSTASLAVGLILTWVVLLFLPEHADRFAAERAPLLQATALFAVAAAASAASFYGELRLRPWRLAAHGSMAAMLALAVWVYWPRP
jgi:hypothetical protein